MHTMFLKVRKAKPVSNAANVPVKPLQVAVKVCKDAL